MAEPRQRSDDEARNRRTQYLINNALHIPRLLQSVRTRSTDLDDMLTQLEELIFSVPPACRTEEDISKLNAVVDMFSQSILGTLVDILLSDRWYSSQDYATTNPIMARAIRVLTDLLRIHSDLEDERAQAGFIHRGLPIQNAETEIVRLFQKLWKHRHDILPIPADDKTFWELKTGNTTADPHELLESAVVQLILTYGNAFAQRFPTYRTTKYTMESGLLHIHCLSRTEHFVNFTKTVATPPLFSTTEGIKQFNVPLWSAVLDDTREFKGLERQLLMRLRDDAIIDHPLADLISCTVSYCTYGWVQIDGARREQLLHRVTRALERQICSGTLQTDIVKSSAMASETCGILRLWLVPNMEPYYHAIYPGDISRLDVIGVLAYSSVLIIRYDADKIPLILAVVHYCTQVAEQYKAAPSHHDRFARLVQRAKICVSKTIHALQEIQIPDMPHEEQDLLAQLVEAWTKYAAVVGVDESGSADERLGASPETFPFRTCALRTCLCHGKKPAHKMRVCMGCREVFYCNEKCQTEHWEKWGHRDRCQQ